MAKPLLSVVIPVFNRPEDLERALDSLTQQTHENFEVIIVDDGSSVDVKSVADRYLDKLKINYTRIENSGGPARPRNTGVKMASTHWISFLDSDDWWKPSRVAEIAKAITNHKHADIFYHKLTISSDGAVGKWWSKTTVGHKLEGDPFIHLLTHGDGLPNSSVVVNKSCFERFGYLNEDAALVSVEDFDYWLKLAQNKCRFQFINKSLGFYWIGPAGISANVDRTLQCNKTVLEKYLPALDKHAQDLAWSKYFYFAGSVLYSTGNPQDALGYFRRANQLQGLGQKAKRFWKIIGILIQLRQFRFH